jgi:adenylate cyclase
VTNVDALFEWLLDGGPGASSSVEVADRLGHGLVEAGIPLQRLGVFVTTLHPSVIGRAFIWQRGEPTRVELLTQAIEQSPRFQNSPVTWCTLNAKEWRWRVGEPDGGFPVIAELAGRGMVDYLCLPLRFTSGQIHVLTVATDVGFTDEQLAAIRHVARPLARLAEILAMRRTATNILSTYVGAISGERVMAGRIFKGDVETIRAGIWFSDLRGFTELSSRLDAREVIAILNDVFECQVPAIEKHGGEVLKFIGDGLLAIFPITDTSTAETRCRGALAAAAETFAELAAVNARTARDLRIGLALHVGDVAYGNIGGASRLDFTAIGSAVNQAARLEGIASKLGRALVVSAEFAEQSRQPFVELGSYELKGLTGPQRVFGEVAGDRR